MKAVDEIEGKKKSRKNKKIKMIIKQGSEVV